MNEKIIKKLMKLNKKTIRCLEVPVSALIVNNNKIIASASNNREKHNNVLGHAEINCIIKASKKLKTWKLTECDLYVTLKPCEMCEKIIKESRIKNVYYFLEKTENKRMYDKTQFIKLESNNITQQFKKDLKAFFKSKRTNVR